MQIQLPNEKTGIQELEDKLASSDLQSQIGGWQETCCVSVCRDQEPILHM